MCWVLVVFFKKHLLSVLNWILFSQYYFINNLRYVLWEGKRIILFQNIFHTILRACQAISKRAFHHAWAEKWNSIYSLLLTALVSVPLGMSVKRNSMWALILILYFHAMSICRSKLFWTGRKKILIASKSFWWHSN